MLSVDVCMQVLKRPFKLFQVIMKIGILNDSGGTWRGEPVNFNKCPNIFNFLRNARQQIQELNLFKRLGVYKNEDGISKEKFEIFSVSTS